MTGPVDVEEQDDPFGQPLRHLPRLAPPWSEPDVTVCGRPMSDVRSVVSFEDARALYRRHGQARAVFLFCQTCIASHRGKAHIETRFERAPAHVVVDWASRAGSFYYKKDTPEAARIEAELKALAALAAEHREEFDTLVARFLTPDEFAAKRAQKRGRG